MKEKKNSLFEKVLNKSSPAPHCSFRTRPMVEYKSHLFFLPFLFSLPSPKYQKKKSIDINGIHKNRSKNIVKKITCGTENSHIISSRQYNTHFIQKKKSRPHIKNIMVGLNFFEPKKMRLPLSGTKCPPNLGQFVPDMALYLKYIYQYTHTHIYIYYNFLIVQRHSQFSH